MSDEKVNENEQFEAVEETSGEPSSPLFVLLLLLAAPIAGIVMGNWVTRGFCILLILFIFRGYRRGAARTIATLICLVAVPLLAIPAGRYAHDTFASILGTSGMTNRIISTFACGMILYFVLRLVIKFALGGAITLTGTRRMDKVLGGLLGMLQGGVVGLLLLWVILAVAPLAAETLVVKNNEDAGGDSTNAEKVASLRNSWAGRFAALGRMTDESAVGRASRAVSPVKDMSIVSTLRKATIVFNDPAARERFLKHPAIQKLKDSESFKNAMTKFENDPKMREMAEQGREGGARKAAAFLHSESIMQMLDETDITAELGSVREAVDDAYSQIKPE